MELRAAVVLSLVALGTSTASVLQNEVINVPVSIARVLELVTVGLVLVVLWFIRIAYKSYKDDVDKRFAAHSKRIDKVEYDRERDFAGLSELIRQLQTVTTRLETVCPFVHPDKERLKAELRRLEEET